MNNNITAAILCGGKSTRIGREKAFSLLNNIPIFEHVLKKLKDIFPKIIISSNNPMFFKKYNIPIVEDIVKNKDAIGGIYSILKNIDTEYAFIVACDMPFIDKKAVKILLENVNDNDVVIPRINGRFQPLFAIYSKNTIPEIEKSIKENNLKITSILHKIKTKVVSDSYFQGIDIKKNFFNINTEKDYEKAVKNKFKDTLVIAIVAKSSNSGKTTLITNLIKFFKNDNLKVGVIKDTFHKIEIDKTGKDSYKFFETGADSVVINSANELVVRKRLDKKFPVKYIKDKFLDEMDIILLEGHKTGNFTKIELIKDGQNDFLFEKDPNIIAVVSDKDLKCSVPLFKHNEYKKIYEFIKAKCLK